MKRFIRTICIVVDVLAIIALIIYAFADNVILDVMCSVVIIAACVLELIYLYMNRKTASHDK